MRTTSVQVAFVGILLAAALPVSAEELLPPEIPVAEAIDHYVGARLQEENIQPAPDVDAAQLIRRTTLDLAGRIPTAAEARAFIDSDAPDKRLQLVDRLMASPDFNYHHRNQLDAMLLPERRNDGPWRDYLLTAVEDNRPWDQMFREMIIGREDDPKHKGALTFVRTRAKDLDKLTNATSQIFFGVSINCAKCHDHPLVLDWTQDHFYGMKSFFSRTYLTKKQTVAEAYRGVVKFTTTEGEEKQAALMFLTGETVDEPAIEKTDEQRKAEDQEVKRQKQDADAPPPKPPEFSPRAQLAELALNDHEENFFARSIVNRIWHRLLGRGLVDPLDQMHSVNPASHPELLDWLARDLVAHDFDLRRLIRGIVLSTSYARSSRWTGEGEPPDDDLFAIAKARPLTPRQYSLSLLIGTANPESFSVEPEPEEWKKRRAAWENAAGGLAQKLEMPSDNFQVSVDEALLFSNSGRIHDDYLRDGNDRLVGYLKQIPDRRALIEAAFWSVLTRAPEPAELEAFQGYLAHREDRPVEAVQQIVWALMTSPELRFNY